MLCKTHSPFCEHSRQCYNSLRTLPSGTMSNSVTDKGPKEVSGRSTGHNKNRLTVFLSAKGDGTKLNPYMLFPRNRPLPEQVKRFRGKAVLKFEGTNWMNRALTEDYLQNVIGPPMFTPQRLLVWDSFRCHITRLGTPH